MIDFIKLVGLKQLLKAYFKEQFPITAIFLIVGVLFGLFILPLLLK